MQAVSRKVLFVKLSVVAVAVVFAAFGFQQFTAKYNKVGASASGPTPSHTGAPGESNCTACHSDNPVNTGSGGVSISALPANYLPNQQIPVTVTTSKEDAVIYGFQITALDGQNRRVGTYTLASQSPAQTRIANGIVGGVQRSYVEHTIDGVVPTAFGSKSWTFTWTAPAQRAGKVSFYVAGNAANSDGGTSGDYIYTNSRSTLSGSAISNFDADGKSDVAVFRPSSGTWFSLNSTNGNFNAVQFGATGDRIVPGDYDGDGRTDYAVWRPSSGIWYVLKSSGGTSSVQFGASDDIPVGGDYDGDLKADFAVYRPSNGFWYVNRSSTNSLSVTQFGNSTDKPAQGDYDADGKTDIAVYRPSSGTWYLNRSTAGQLAVQFGLSGDKPVQGDYDGDGKIDIALYRPSDGGWYLLQSRDGFTALQFGLSTDKPIPADYDGDGKTDVAVLRGGIWYIRRSTDGSFYGVGFGSSEDIPVPSGYLAQ
ncbi:MAG: FG-GAP-like repeat-containing protein [Pyrinomonadaceae bacterium]|nr:FG-GAP-like repeat-containing protein [Pyrinomonadaceae bacterium]